VYNWFVVAVDLSQPSPHLRQLDVHRDLVATADLIELCFASTLDADGREYLRQIRRAAADPAYMRWLPGAYERVTTPLFGYVWEQDHRIVGNLSLIPIHKDSRWIYLIANVAVHPDYRRRGIAYQLTLRALEHIREHRVSHAWLQVRHDNLSAYELYRSTGFVERSRRTTWVNHFNPALPASGSVRVVPRRSQDWERQRAWLDEVYPVEATWNLPFQPDRFNPNTWLRLLRWLNGDIQQHWSAVNSVTGQVLGVASWEPMRLVAEQVWIATSQENEDAAIRSLVPHLRQYLVARQRTVAINYPAGRAEPAFYDCGFIPQNTLIWMEHRI
jgi:ribosomal protein S18 acetylase RimI-like enzyme